jgi:hypothetical protein
MNYGLVVIWCAPQAFRSFRPDLRSLWSKRLPTDKEMAQIESVGRLIRFGKKMVLVRD